MTSRRLPWDRIAPVAFLILVAFVLAACATHGAPGGSAPPTPTVMPAPPLEPAQPGADPVSFLAWIFTPIFR